MSSDLQHHCKVGSVLDLFSGIGGFSIGFERAGFCTAAFAEVDAFASAVLATRWPTVPNVGDVTRIDGGEWRGKVDVVTFGSPCQDLSVAGQRRGLRGERSGLFFEAVRIIAECRPAFALWENVPGAFSINGGRDFGAVLLTPRECERLQGFPDDWTLIPYRNRPAADGPRYRAIGNSVAVPVIGWIAQRMAAVLRGQPKAA